MTRFVIGPDVAVHLAADRVVPLVEHRLVAPTLLRSQVLSLLYESARRAEITRTEAGRRLDFIRGLQIRLLGDRVSQRVAWDVADQLGMADTFAAEYLAVTRLQADAFITLDADLARRAQTVVTTAPMDALLRPGP